MQTLRGLERQIVIQRVNLPGIARGFSLGSLLVFILLLFPLVQLFVPLVLKQPDRICISPDEFVFTGAFNKKRPLDSLLFAVDENGHVLLP